MCIDVYVVSHSSFVVLTSLREHKFVKVLFFCISTFSRFLLRNTGPTAFAAAAKSKEAGHLCCSTNVHRDVVALTDKGRGLDQDPSHRCLQMVQCM